MAWDGRRWRVDTTGEVYRLARKTIPRIRDEAAKVASDKELCKEILKFADYTESRRGIEAMIHLAQFVEGVPVDPSELDRDPWLLTVANETIDLQSGELRPHSHLDLITKLADVNCDHDALCPRWEQFEREIMDGKDDLVKYLRRIAGYGMTGVVREHELYLFHGAGRNGKSLRLSLIQKILGDYAATVNAALITSRIHDDHPTGLIDLEGRRFVSTIEVADGKRLAEALVKQLTGGDPIRTRRMRQE